LFLVAVRPSRLIEAASGAEQKFHITVEPDRNQEAEMGFGRGALLWLLGVPLPIVLLLALFWHH
jgi:hypothetical protein